MNLTINSQVLVQGIFDVLGEKYLAQMQDYGTTIAGIVSVGNGKTTWGNIPVFDLVEQATAALEDISTTLIFNPPCSVLDAVLEAIDGGIRQVIIITGDIPPLDTVRLLRKARATATTVIGPGSAGIIIPGQLLLGNQEPGFYSPGSIALVSCSSSLTVEVAMALTKAGLGQSVSINLGSDAILGTDFSQCLEFLSKDPRTEAIVLLDHGNSGNSNFYLDSGLAVGKPLVAYVAGHLLPKETQVPETGSVIASQFASTVVTTSNAKVKINALKKLKIPVADYPSQIPDLIKKAIGKISNS